MKKYPTLEKVLAAPAQPTNPETNQELKGLLQNFNTRGAVIDRPFGFSDLEKPIYHKLGRYIPDAYVTSPKVREVKGLNCVGIQVFIEAVEGLLKNAKRCEALGADLVQIPWAINTDILSGLFNPAFNDSKDSLEEYNRFEEAFRKAYGRSPSIHDINDILKGK